MENVWVLGCWVDDTWEIAGIFTSREEALAAGKAGWFVGPIPLNTPMPSETVPWPDLELVS
jgi:hypothetical protein